MAVDYSRLAPQQVISSRTFRVDAETVSRYVQAVGDSSLPDGGRAYVPPMAIAALGLRGVIADLAIPGGTLHLGQELEFLKAVRVGEALECRATLLQNSLRGEWRFMVVQLQVTDGKGQKVMEGKSTITVPAGP